MVSLSPLQKRLAAVATWPALIPGRTAAPGLWILVVVLGSLLTWWVTGLTWLAVTVGIAGMVLAARHLVKMLAALQTGLAHAEAERAAMELALRKSQQMEALGRLAVGIAHDFNNHLTVISSNVEMMARRPDSPHERLLRHADAAMQGVQRAALLTGRLLSFSRQPEADPEPVDVNRLLGRLSDLLRRTLGERIGLDVRLSGEPWFIWADMNQSENALLSLAVNARDQVLDGGTLIIAMTNVHLDEVFSQANPWVLPGDHIQIAVSDFVETAERKQWQAADDLSSADLSMARAFVREAGGCLLRSDPAAGGLSLRIFLPRYVHPSPVAAVSRRSQDGRATILVVEDDAAVRAVCVETLRDLDFDVLEAPEAMEAFRLIADRGGIDLLFTDLGLPGGVSGRALADAARNVDAGMRVLFTTGYERAGLRERGGTALLCKPFNPAQLIAKVREVLAAERTIERSETVQG